MVMYNVAIYSGFPLYDVMRSAIEMASPRIIALYVLSRFNISVFISSGSTTIVFRFVVCTSIDERYEVAPKNRICKTIHV